MSRNWRYLRRNVLAGGRRNYATSLAEEKRFNLAGVERAVRSTDAVAGQSYVNSTIVRGENVIAAAGTITLVFILPLVVPTVTRCPVTLRVEPCRRRTEYQLSSSRHLQADGRRHTAHVDMRFRML